MFQYERCKNYKFVPRNEILNDFGPVVDDLLTNICTKYLGIRLLLTLCMLDKNFTGKQKI